MATNERVSAGLNGLLADATIFYQKLRHYHWNVEGRAFFELHAKFETLYTRWATAIDEIAERILMIGGVPLHTLTSMLKEARLVEDEGIPSAAEMVDAVLAAMSESEQAPTGTNALEAAANALTGGEPAPLEDKTQGDPAESDETLEAELDSVVDGEATGEPALQVDDWFLNREKLLWHWPYMQDSVVQELD